MNNKSHVYILSAYDCDYLKIGKANDVINRIKTIGIMNMIDFSKSWCIEVKSEDCAFAVENVLHNMFSDKRVTVDFGLCGRTEWFHKSIYASALIAIGGEKADPIIKIEKKRRGFTDEAIDDLRWICLNTDKMINIDSDYIKRVISAKNNGVPIEYMAKHGFINRADITIFDNL